MNRLKQELYKNLQQMSKDDYMKYSIEALNGYIKINQHPEDENIVILNYTDLTTYERRWNEQTMTARGLILDITSANDNGIVYILAKPFDKFFNYEENPEYESDIDFNQIENIMEKMDGSLGISYFFEDGIRFATRGSFISDQAIKATEIWNKKYAHRLHRQQYSKTPFTMLTEIIYPENRIVVNYDNIEDLVLLGVRDIRKDSTVDDWNTTSVKFLGTHLDMTVAHVYENKTILDLLELKKSISANEEGWIVKFKNNKRLKIKGDEYIEVHRIKHGMSTKAKYRAWAEGNLNDYIMMLPEEFRPELEEFREKVESIKNVRMYILTMLFEQANSEYEDKKDFALHVNSVISRDFRKFLFDARKNGVISEQKVKEDIFDNYIDYEKELESHWKLNNQDL